MGNNYVPNIYCAVLITLTVAVVALVLRLKARRLTKMRLWYDDYLCIVAFIFAVAYCTTVLVWTEHFSLGQSIAGYSPERQAYILEKSRLTLWIGEFCYASSIGFSKLSVLSFYWRIFQFTSIRIPIRVLLVAVGIWLTMRTFMVIFHCVPVQAYWDKTIEPRNCRIDPSKFFVGTIITHCTMDIIILVLPVVEVIKMHLTFGQKIAIISLFTSGIIVCVASILVVIESFRYEPLSKEMPRDTAFSLLYAAVETNMAVFSSCLPMLRSIFSKYIPTLVSSLRGHSLRDRTAPTHLENVRVPKESGTSTGGEGRFENSNNDDVRLEDVEDGPAAGNTHRIQPKTSRGSGPADFL